MRGANVVFWCINWSKRGNNTSKTGDTDLDTMLEVWLYPNIRLVSSYTMKEDMSDMLQSYVRASQPLILNFAH